MFKFKFILDYFQRTGAGGPTREANMRAKWLSLYCPDDIDLAFAPYPGQRPLYTPERVKLVKQDEPGWWNHYFFNSALIDREQSGNWSLGPNVDTSRPVLNNTLTVVYSIYQKQKLLERWSLPPDDVIVIPNMIDLEIFSPGRKANRPTVGWIGYDHKSRMTKGVEVIPYLAQRFPDVHFEMVHARPPRFQHEWLPQPLSNLRIMHGVAHDEMVHIIRRWHVLVCGSKWETFGSHVLEAMACGVPVIAAHVGAIPEVAKGQLLLKDMKWGQPPAVPHPYDWTSESLERFGDALQQLLSDKVLYRLLEERALQESKRFQPETVAKQWYDFIYRCQELASPQ